MSRPTITLRYEVQVRDRYTKTNVEAPDNWETMTDAERHAWCQGQLAEGLADIVGQAYDWDGVPQ